MLEHSQSHDELLPVEEANSALVEELRTIYQLTPQERQVLSRVHERLQIYAQPLPVREPAEAGLRAVRRETPSVSRELVFPRRKFLAQLNGVAAVLFVAILVGALTLTFTAVKHPTPASVTPVNGIHVFLVPAQTTAPSKDTLARTANILSQRISNFGLQGYSIHVQAVEKQTGIQLILPQFGSDEQQTLGILLGSGVLAFWNTGTVSLMQGTLLAPNQFSGYNPGGRPLFTGVDLNPDSLQVSSDQATGLPVIQCSMQGYAVQRFQQFTSSNIGNYLTITLDGNVLTSAIIQSPIAGPFTIAGNFSQHWAKALVAVLKYGPLPLAMKRLP